MGLSPGRGDLENTGNAYQDANLINTIALGGNLLMNVGPTARYAWPFGNIQLPGLAGRVEYAQLLHDGSEIKFTEGELKHFGVGVPKEDKLLVLEIPVLKPDVTVPVIELFLR